MAAITDVLTDLGEGPHVYREMGAGENSLGILVGPRTKPRCIVPGFTGFLLGLHGENWAKKQCTGSGAATYFVRVKPIYDKMIDPNGHPLEGTPNTENASKATTFTFEPFPAGYPCTGYRVYAGTVTAILYYQGELLGRDNTFFTIGTTWALNSGPAGLLSALSQGPPAFADVIEVYQEEGGVDSRLFMAGGQAYTRGYARVDSEGRAPKLECGSDNAIDVTALNTIDDASFRMRLDGAWWDFGGIDFTATGPLGHAADNMYEIASVIQTSIRAAQSGYLACGTSPEAVANFQVVADGTCSVLMNGTQVDIGDIDFEDYNYSGVAVADEDEIAAAIQTALQRRGCPILVVWDSTRGAYFLSNASGYTIPEMFRNPTFGAVLGWERETDDWTVDTANNEADFNSGVGEKLVDGGFADPTKWTYSQHFTVAGNILTHNSGTWNEVSDPYCNTPAAWKTDWFASSDWAVSAGYLKYTKAGPSSTADFISHDLSSGPSGTSLQVGVNVTQLNSGVIRVGFLNAAGAPVKTVGSITSIGRHVFSGYAPAGARHLFFAVVGASNPAIWISDVIVEYGVSPLQSECSQVVGPIQGFVWTTSMDIVGMVTGDAVRIVLRGSRSGDEVAGSLQIADGAGLTEEIAVPAGMEIDTFVIQNYSWGGVAATYTVDNVSLAQSTPDDATALIQKVGYIGGLTITVTGQLNNIGGAEGLYIEVRDPEGNVGDISGKLVADFSEDLVVPSDGNHYDRIAFKNAAVGGSTYELYNVSCKIKTAFSFPMSYLFGPGVEGGTLISGMVQGEDGNEGVHLNNATKGSTTEKVYWLNDIIVIEGANVGDEYDLSFLEQAIYNIGTDIHSTGYVDGSEDGNGVNYIPGRTAGNFVRGDGTEWGPWAEGMLFRAEDDAGSVLVREYIDEKTLLLDSEYTGVALDSNQKYILKPYYAQIYPSGLGNPFAFSAEDIVRLPTGDSDRITFLRRLGTNIAIGMQHHLWLIDGVHLGAPKMISDIYGAPNPNCVIAFGNGLAVLTGEDFVAITEGRVQSMDPDNRVKAIIARMEDGGQGAHGRLVWTERGPVLKWWVKIDGSDVCNMVIVYDPRRGNFWPENSYPDARCSATIRDAQDVSKLYTASSADPFYEESGDPDMHFYSRVFLHGRDYKNEGAPAAATAQGLISVVNDGQTYGYSANSGDGEVNPATWRTLTSASFGIMWGGKEYLCGPIDFSASGENVQTIAEVATAVQNAINATDIPSLAGENISVALVPTTPAQFQFTYATGFVHKIIGPLTPYYATADSTDISVEAWLNGRTLVYNPLSLQVTALTLTKMDGSAITDPTTKALVQGLYIYVCDSQLRNGQFHKVVDWNTTFHRAHIPPEASVTVKAGWYWFLGGIVPRWKKWWDYGSPQHKQKTYSLIMTVDPNEGASGNNLAVHGYQDLVETIRTTQLVALGGTADTVHRVDILDKPATQQGLEIIRPSSEHDLQIEDLVLTHRANV